MNKSKSFLDIVHMNYEKEHIEYLKEREIEIKQKIKDQKKENVINCILIGVIATFVLVGTIILTILITDQKPANTAIQHCVEQGYGQTYCEKNYYGY